MNLFQLSMKCLETGFLGCYKTSSKTLLETSIFFKYNSFEFDIENIVFLIFFIKKILITQTQRKIQNKKKKKIQNRKKMFWFS